MQISESQKRAIAHRDGPAMVLAGPGSGKTLVITQRTKYLIDTYHIDPGKILVITFTKAAAQEMRGRFQKICNRGGVTFGTFHAVFFTVLKNAYHYTSENVMSEDDRQKILKQLLNDYCPESRNDQDTLSELEAEISLVKNEQIPLEHYYARSCPEDVFRDIYRGYEDIHRKMNMLDFDDMLTCTLELLTQRPDILKCWQQKWKYILTDEFQDINLLQYRILKLLAAPQDNLFIVGDDDQSIYRFRGAKPEIMLNFPKDYPDAETILLDQNFRSTPQIISGAALVINENKKRFSKNIRHVRKDGSEIEFREFLNQNNESLYIVQQIRKSTEEGIPYSEIAILVRTKLGAGPFAERLSEFNIPFVFSEVMPSVYDHWIAKDIFTYIRLSQGKMDRGDFLQVMNRPDRYIGRDSIDSAAVSFDRLRFYYRDSVRMTGRINSFEADLQFLSNLSPYAAVSFIRSGMGYEKFLNEYAAGRHMKSEGLLEVLDELQESARPYRTMDEWYAHIDEYKKALEENRKEKAKIRKDAVTILTLHASKGLEFAEVFLPDVNEGILPHSRAMLEADIEEERRLFYVGMTRAKDRLHIFHIKERYGKVMEPSSFLNVFDQSASSSSSDVRS